MRRQLPLLMMAVCFQLAAPPLRADPTDDAWHKARLELQLRGAVMGMSRDPVVTWFLFPVQTTDAQLKAFPFVPQEFHIHLFGAHVTDAGLKELKSVPNLIGLKLRRTRISDAGMKELAAMKELVALSLADTAVSDAGLDELTKLPKLRVLELTDSRATWKGVAALRAALPNCQINWTERPTIKTDPKLRDEVRKKFKAVPAAILGIEEPITNVTFSQHERRSTSSGFIEISFKDAGGTKSSLLLQPCQDDDSVRQFQESKILWRPNRQVLAVAGPEEAALYGLLLRWQQARPKNAAEEIDQEMTWFLDRLDIRFKAGVTIVSPPRRDEPAAKK